MKRFWLVLGKATTSALFVWTSIWLVAAAPAAAQSKADPLDICHDYIDTVTSNIGHFLAGKPHVANVAVETGKAEAVKK